MESAVIGRNIRAFILFSRASYRRRSRRAAGNLPAFPADRKNHAILAEAPAVPGLVPADKWNGGKTIIWTGLNLPAESAVWVFTDRNQSRKKQDLSLGMASFERSMSFGCALKRKRLIDPHLQLTVGYPLENIAGSQIKFLWGRRIMGQAGAGNVDRPFGIKNRQIYWWDWAARLAVQYHHPPAF
jgi:hypothetical protein